MLLFKKEYIKHIDNNKQDLKLRGLNVCFYFPEPLPTESPFGKCPEGYEDLGHEQFCYRIFNEDYSMTWDMAREQCQNWEGDLVSIHSEQENSMIHSFISSEYTTAWIGLRLIDEGNKIILNDIS